MKNVNHIQHKRSNSATSGNPTYPSPSSIEVGELALNYAVSAETIFLKNSAGVVIPFSSDERFQREKLGDFEEYWKNKQDSALTYNTVVEMLNNNIDVASGAIDGKQDTLVSGTNIKTINNESILGSGNIEIESADVDDTLSSSSTNPVQNKVIYNALTGKTEQNDFTGHTANTTYHVSSSDRTKWDAVTAKTNQTDFTAHTSDTDVHVSSEDREVWDTVSEKADQGELEALNENLTAHTSNQTVHVTQANKDTWNTVTSKANQSDLTAHTTNADVHVTTGDKATWNTVSSKASQSDLNTLSSATTAHTGDQTIHITSSERTKWNAKVDVTAMTAAINAATSGKAEQSDLTALSTITSTHTANTSIHVSTNDRTLWNSVSGKADSSAITNFIDSVEYVVSGTSHDIVFYHGTTKVDSINANAFIKDGMVDNVQISGGNLIITFNTDSGKDAITIPLTDIFDPSNYYTKTETDALLSAKTDVSTFNGLKNTVTGHTANTTIHVSSADRTKWDAVTAKTNQSDFTAHTANTDVHVTTGDKNTWNTVTTKASQTDLNTLSATTTAHTSDQTVHVTQANKTTWNAVTAKTNTSAFTAHTASTDVHVTTGDKATWNTVTSKASQSDLNTLSATTTAHTADTTIHVTSEDKTKWDDVTSKADQDDLTAHTANTDVHVTTGDKSTWNTVSTKASQNDLNTLSATTTAHTADTTKHVTAADKTKWDAVTAKTDTSAFTAHTASTAMHVTTGDKATWNTVTSKASQSDLNTHTGNTTIHITADERTKWNAVSGKVDTSAVTGYIDSVEYVVNGTAHTIVFYHGTTQVDSVDANAFIKDGMVDNVQISGGNLVITFNTDSGKDNISIPLTDIFNPNNYYDKTAVNNLLTAKTDVSAFTSHTASTTVHITADERTKWNASLSSVTVNEVSATVSNRVAVVTIDASDVLLGGDYDGEDVTITTTGGTQHLAPISSDTVSQAISKLTKEILDNEETIASTESVLSGAIDDHKADTAVHMTTTQKSALSGYDTSKGSIEARLTRLEVLINRLLNQSS